MGVFSSFKNLLQSKKNYKKAVQTKASFDKDDNKEQLFTALSNFEKPIISVSNGIDNIISTSSSEKNPSNISSFQFKDGRRYIADESVSYILPNDDDEVYRLDKQHWILRYALQCNFQSPIKKKLERGITVLDSGCGPGTWALELADSFPHSIFHCVDAAPVFSEDKRRPNVHFVVGNVAKSVPFDDNYFDFIHQRLLVIGLTDDDWTNTLKHMYRVLKPGGYIELAEPDVQEMPNAGPAMRLLQSTLGEMSIAYGFPPRIATELKSRLKEAGFKSIKVKTTDIPLNHGGRVGEFFWEDYKHGFINLRPVMAKSNSEWEDAEAYEAYINKCGEEAKENKTCLKWYSIHARKPKEIIAAEKDLRLVLQEKLILEE